jgi:hypothetical protein
LQKMQQLRLQREAGAFLTSAAPRQPVQPPPPLLSTRVRLA